MVFFLVILTISLSLSFVLALLAFFEYGPRKWGAKKKNPIDSVYPPISIIIPMYNEETIITKTTKALQNITYPDYELIIVDDGSTDTSLEKLNNLLRLQIVFRDVPENLKHQSIQRIFHSQYDKRITVISKIRGGKFDALNTGINFSSNAWFCCIDADTIIRPNALEVMMERIGKEPTTIGLAGQIRVRSISTKNHFLVSVQAIEYIRSFILERIGWSILQGLVFVSGAFCLFNKQAVCEVGGYSNEVLAEDVELILKLHHYQLGRNRRYRIEYIPEAVAFTDVPTNIRSLAKQRERWYLGLWISIYKHRSMFWRLRYKIIGLFVLPYLLIFELMWPIIVITALLISTLTKNIFHSTLSAILMAMTIFVARYLTTTIIVLFDQHLWSNKNHENKGSILWSILLESSLFSFLVFLFKLQALVSLFKPSTVISGKWPTLRHKDAKANPEPII